MVVSTGLDAIDCDLHPTVPGMRALLPYLDPVWRSTVVDRGIDSLESTSYPPSAPVSVRPDWRGADGRGATEVGQLQRQLLDPLGIRLGILHCLYGVQMVFNEDMAVAIARAINDWVAAEWLDRDPRLRATIVLPLQSVPRAVAEIERLAPDRRFVGALVLAMGDAPLGRREFWPIYEACEKHALPLCIHAGSAYRHPVTSLGWPSFYIEDYASQSLGFQSQVASLVCEGVFTKFPGLRAVLLESGVTWLPALLWRLSKFWRGLRSEVPWLDRSPAEIVRDHLRLTVQPLDAPGAPAEAARALEHLARDDMLLFASDYPHWNFDGDAALPPGLPERLRRRILTENALATFPRLREDQR
ncbi:amidohydrolase family protein [Roseomonas sp. BN140053]|uniref:amidohydrolase family protein n=1 Tax=Roseomonas sp. BN140053 TaxID=3391898 RepID=UPI0039EAEF6E